MNRSLDPRHDAFLADIEALRFPEPIFHWVAKDPLIEGKQIKKLFVVWNLQKCPEVRKIEECHSKIDFIASAYNIDTPQLQHKFEGSAALGNGIATLIMQSDYIRSEKFLLGNSFQISPKVAIDMGFYNSMAHLLGDIVEWGGHDVSVIRPSRNSSYEERFYIVLSLYRCVTRLQKNKNSEFVASLKQLCEINQQLSNNVFKIAKTLYDPERL